MIEHADNDRINNCDHEPKPVFGITLRLVDRLCNIEESVFIKHVQWTVLAEDLDWKTQATATRSIRERIVYVLTLLHSDKAKVRFSGNYHFLLKSFVAALGQGRVAQLLSSDLERRYPTAQSFYESLKGIADQVFLNTMQYQSHKIQQVDADMYVILGLVQDLYDDATMHDETMSKISFAADQMTSSIGELRAALVDAQRPVPDNRFDDIFNLVATLTSEVRGERS